MAQTPDLTITLSNFATINDRIGAVAAVEYELV
jgi:hypothetical protein